MVTERAGRAPCSVRRERDQDSEAEEAAPAAAAAARAAPLKRDRRLPSLRLANGRLGTANGASGGGIAGSGGSSGGLAGAGSGGLGSIGSGGIGSIGSGGIGSIGSGGGVSIAGAVGGGLEPSAPPADGLDAAAPRPTLPPADGNGASDSLVTAADDSELVSDYISPEMNYREQKVRIQSLTDEGSLYGTPREEVQHGVPLATVSSPPTSPSAHFEPKQGFIRYQLSNLFQPTDNKLAMKLFGSKKALMKERIRQKAAGHWIIHPCSNFR